MKTPRIDTTELAEHIEKAARGVIGARADLAILDLVDRVGVEVRGRLARADDVRAAILQHAAEAELGDEGDPMALLAWIYNVGTAGDIPHPPLSVAVDRALNPPERDADAENDARADRDL